MGIEQVRQFESNYRRPTQIDRLYAAGTLTDDDLETLQEAADEVARGITSTVAVSRWLNSKDGVEISTSAVRTWLAAHA